MDETFIQPVRQVDKDFVMSVDTAVNISGRGCVVTGTIEQGRAKIGEDLHLIGIKRKAIPTTITGIESFHKQLDVAEAGDNVGMLVRGLLRDDIKRGMCLVKPGSLEIRRNFKAEIYVTKEEEGGRHKPFFSGYTPQCFLRTADTSTIVTLPEDKQMAMPGDNFTASMKLFFPLPIIKGQNFALREGGKTVAHGMITELLPDTEEDFKEEDERKKK